MSMRRTKDRFKRKHTTTKPDYYTLMGFLHYQQAAKQAQQELSCSQGHPCHCTLDSLPNTPMQLQ